MRHDPAIAAIIIMLRQLKMFGMAQAVTELAEQGSPAFEAAHPMLSQLLKTESAEREVRSIAYQLKAARFPVYRDLADFDFAHGEVNEALVRSLHRCEFIEKATTWCSSVGPARARRTLLRHWVFKPLSITVKGCASSLLWNWLMPWSKRKCKANPDSSPIGWCIRIW